jgi:hypothetical protein
MDPMEKAQVDLEHELEDKKIRPSSFQKGTLLFAYAGMICGLVGRCDDTGRGLEIIANSLPVNEISAAIHREAMGLIESGTQIHSISQEIFDRLLNAGFLAIAFSGVGQVARKTLDVVSRLRTGYYFREK